MYFEVILLLLFAITIAEWECRVEVIKLPDRLLWRRNWNITKQWCQLRGATRGARGAQFSGRQFTMGALNYCRGVEWLLEVPKSPNNVISTFFNTVNLPSKELRFAHGGAKLRPWGRRFDHGGAEFVFFPGRHLTSLRPCASWHVLQKEMELYETSKKDQTP